MNFLMNMFRMKNWKYIIATIMIIYMILTYALFEVWWAKKQETVKLVLPFVVVHIDLKGTPLKLSYLESLLPTLKDHGVNGLLMEYEDMFPYEGLLANLSAEYCYKKDELKNFLSVAESSGFEIIPLIQTFGHMEFALKLQEFLHLREIPLFPDSICPSNPKSKMLLNDMIKQVMSFHSTVRPLQYIHVGCDEVYNINNCDYCKKRNLSNRELFLKHIETVSNLVSAYDHDTKILIWDDMFRSITPLHWYELPNFPENLHVVCWDYTVNVEDKIPILYKYHRKMANLWFSTAYKGADNRTAVLPDIGNRFYNHYSWLDLAKGYIFAGDKEIYNFKGIILTGWSRYSHMDPPCELLPVAMPSLLLNLILIEKFRDGISCAADEEGSCKVDKLFRHHLNHELKDNIGCVIDEDIQNFDSTKCSYDGHLLYAVMKKYKSLHSKLIEDLYNQNCPLNLGEYYFQSNYININTVVDLIKKCSENINIVTDLKKAMVKEMSKYYQKEFIREYVEFRFYQIEDKLNELISIYKIFNKNVRTWQRRTIQAIEYFNDTNL